MSNKPSTSNASIARGRSTATKQTSASGGDLVFSLTDLLGGSEPEDKARTGEKSGRALTSPSSSSKGPSFADGMRRHPPDTLRKSSSMETVFELDNNDDSDASTIFEGSEGEAASNEAEQPKSESVRRAGGSATRRDSSDIRSTEGSHRILKPSSAPHGEAFSSNAKSGRRYGGGGQVSSGGSHGSETDSRNARNSAKTSRGGRGKDGSVWF